MGIIGFINDNILWGIPMLILFALCGILFTVRLKGLQLTFLPKLIKSEKNKNTKDDSVSPFRALTAALGTTLGTGNIIAVGTAIAFGGAGAVFWMWVAAFIGMATAYAEVNLGMKYRTKSENGYGGVPFRYIKASFGRFTKAGSIAAGFFAVCCVLSGFGMGNMAQINSASNVLNKSLGVPKIVVGILIALLLFYFARGGVERLGRVTAWLIPIASVGYTIGCLAVMVINIDSLWSVICRIFTEAFSFDAMAGGAVGTVILSAMKWGVKRGVFSNEAGLGSSVIIHCKAENSTPYSQGLWAMLQVFLDTIVMCSLTAFAILMSGTDLLSTDGYSMAYLAFQNGLGDAAGIFLSLSVFVFVVSTSAGWWVYARQCYLYLFKKKEIIFTSLFIAVAVISPIIGADIVWELSDMFNALMALPNLFALIVLQKQVTLKTDT